ncbi:MAG: hypothetical protein JW850_21115 [Thermoflexales bacterium]|nr:hypothetical protein [Thermoflexales bacterium]
MSVHVFGIRHHGPGSARSLRRALEALQPDVILVEGPPDAADVLPLLPHPQMRPPVALLIYVPDEPRRAVYYPFAIFSPEWQALHYGLTQAIPVRFMDLSQAHRLALDAERPPVRDRLPSPSDQPPEIANRKSQIKNDPLRFLAEAAGYSDGERWWEHMVEQRRDSAELFAAILEAMTALRQEVDQEDEVEASEEALTEAQREATMRTTIRQAQREGLQRIAVVCGAWHAPALVEADQATARDDAALLKGLPKVQVQATWVPWTNGRLSWASGYGAGIESPGWYHYLWTSSEAGLDSTSVAVGWLTHVAQLLREQDLDASSAHVIEAVRLAESLAALRDRPLPGLPELSDAVQTVFCFGSDVPMRLIGAKLIIGESLGGVPDETPAVPLQQDLAAQQKRLRFPPSAEQKRHDFDLRKPTELARSHLLHRLNLLGVPWGKLQGVDKRKKGTFHEPWLVQWQGEFAVSVIEAALWGNTVEDAATARAGRAAKDAKLPALTRLVNQALLADLPAAIGRLMERLQTEAALANDVGHLMDALPPLADVLRYGSVRKTDASIVSHVIDGLVARICVGLPVACASLNDDAAAAMFERLVRVHGAITLVQDEAQLGAWQQVLVQLTDQEGMHGLLAGRCCRLLLDAGRLPLDEVARRMELALSVGSEPAQAAAWVDGLLKGSGLLLLHHDDLWQVIDRWVTALKGEAFVAALPLLRRTFATFAAPERRQMGERARHGLARPADDAQAQAGFDTARAEQVLPMLAQLLGLENA